MLWCSTGREREREGESIGAAQGAATQGPVQRCGGKRSCKPSVYLWAGLWCGPAYGVGRPKRKVTRNRVQRFRVAVRSTLLLHRAPRFRVKFDR